MPKRKQPENTRPKVNNPNVMGLRAAVLEQPITETLESNYMPYAMSVIVSRAIPEIDGFKPSHRKLLYTMYNMGLLTKVRTKSANIVGQTMRLNPHGDAAIYDTMVRLSRGYGALLTPFVDSKGNFGKAYSRDMSWAAPRYTEAKLTAICQELFRDIDHDTVDFVDNYDATMKEPVLLPTTFPNILVSANSGIAVGMASQFCGFNLKEVCETAIAYLKNPECDLLSTLLAPDFPTGGLLLWDANSMKEIYDTGRGSVRVRAKWEYIKKENLIEITEIPYSTTIEAILDKTADLIKSGKAKEIADMRDETDLSGLKLTIDLKRGADPNKLMSRLFKSTPLEDSFACNFNVLIGGIPKVLGVRAILDEWSAWRMESVRRRVCFILNQRKDKLHLLEGLKKILLDLDQAIQIIRETEQESEVVANLMIGFGVDEIQADYIAEIKLRNINREYILKRVQETEDLQKEIADLREILDNPKKIQKIMIDELKAVIKKYGEPRRTEILYDYDHISGQEEEPEEEYPVKIFLSREGYFKKITPLSLRMGGEQKYKEGDELRQSFDTMSNAEIMFVTNQCQIYKTLGEFADTKASVLGDYLPGKLNLADGENIIYAILPGDYTGYLLFFYENGKAARVPLSAYQTASNRRKLTGAYSDKSPLINIIKLDAGAEADIAVYASDNRCFVFNSILLEPKATRTTQGVMILTVKSKANRSLIRACSLEESEITNISRYRVRVIPSSGIALKPEDAEETQMKMEL